jgi:hypothetical protein
VGGVSQLRFLELQIPDKLEVTAILKVFPVLIIENVVNIQNYIFMLESPLLFQRIGT